MAPVVMELQRRPEEFRVITCVTAQHRQMLDQVLSLFGIVPEFDLNVMQPSQDLFEITARILLGMRDVLHQTQPDICLVHGDTTTTLAASLAAYYQKVPVGHIEAGLRTYDPYAPFPEEINRTVTGHIAKYHLAPTSTNRDNLLREGVSSGKIVVTGNTVIDALLWTEAKIASDPTEAFRLERSIGEKGYHFTDRRILLVTGHRRENFGEGFINICQALLGIAHTRSDIDIVYPVHLNPNVKGPVYSLLSGKSNIYLIDPLDYESFVFMMSRSYVILTDSGGIQEEAPSLGKPVLVMRDATERPDAVTAGTVKIVGTSQTQIQHAVLQLFEDEREYQAMSRVINPYGDGTASRRIANFLANI